MLNLEKLIKMCIRKLVIGDLHGAVLALEQVLDRCNYNPKEDKLIFLGDYVDGWNHSAELIEYLIKIKEKAPEGNTIFVRGNHDAMCEDWLTLEIQHLVWLSNGGSTTIKSYQNNPQINKETHAHFFNDMCNWYLDDENRLFIHGGWEYRSGDFPMSALYPVNAGTKAKECHWDRTLLMGAKSAHSGKTSLRATRPFKEVYIGHTGTDTALPENYGNLWNMDTGAGYEGKLTAMDIDTKEFWQSDFVKDIYKDIYEWVL